MASSRTLTIGIPAHLAPADLKALEARERVPLEQVLVRLLEREIVRFSPEAAARTLEELERSGNRSELIEELRRLQG